MAVTRGLRGYASSTPGEKTATLRLPGDFLNFVVGSGLGHSYQSMCRPRYLLLVILLALAGCVGPAERLPDSVPPKRVVLVVLAGDNDLSEEVGWRLDALKQGWTPAMGPLFVLEDRASIEAPRLLRLTCDEVGGKHYRTLASYPYLTDTTSEELWRTVLADVMRQSHPAAHMGIVLFSHGTGWLPEGMLAEPRGLLSDNGREMSPELLGEILPADRVDYLLFDMCFTAGVEVAYALRERIPLLLVSSAEMVSPGFTPLYRSSLRFLYEPQPEGLKKWARDYASLVERQTDLRRSGTLSLVSTAPMDELAEAMQGMTLPSDLGGLQRFDRGSGAPLFYDLGQVISLQEKSRREKAEDCLRRAVLYEWHTETFMGYLPLKHHSGLTIYLPTSAYPQLNRAYDKTAWRRAIAL